MWALFLTCKAQTFVEYHLHLFFFEHLIEIFLVTFCLIEKCDKILPLSGIKIAFQDICKVLLQ